MSVIDRNQERMEGLRTQIATTRSLEEHSRLTNERQELADLIFQEEAMMKRVDEGWLYLKPNIGNS